MSLKSEVEQARGLIRKAKYEEAFQLIQQILTEVKNPYIKKSLNLTEGRFNNYKRKEFRGEVRDDSELNAIIHSFYDQLTELDEIIANEKENEFDEIGKRIVKKISESFAEIEKEDTEQRELLQELKEMPFRYRYSLHLHSITGLDEKFKEAANLVVRNQNASISALQRSLHIGKHYAGRILEHMESIDIIRSKGEDEEFEVLVPSVEQLQKMFDRFEKIEKEEEGQQEKLEQATAPYRNGEYRLIETDERLREAASLIVQNQKAATSIIQRRLSVGYNRAGSIIDQLELANIIGPSEGSNPRETLVSSQEELERIFESFIRVEEEDGEFKEFVIHKHYFDNDEKEVEEEFEHLSTSTLIDQYLPDLSGIIKGFKLKKIDYTLLADFNLIKVQLILEPSPNDAFDIWFDPEYEASIETGFMDLGRMRWGLPLLWVTSVYQYDSSFYQQEELSNADKNDVIVEFFTIGKLPDELQNFADF